MRVSASLKFVRMGSMKARLVADAVRGRPVSEAISRLSMIDRKPARLIRTLLDSAIANAEYKQSIDVGSLYVKAINVDQGPHLKRQMPRARGRASLIRKKTSHIKIVLEERHSGTKG